MVPRKNNECAPRNVNNCAVVCCDAGRIGGTRPYSGPSGAFLAFNPGFCHSVLCLETIRSARCPRGCILVLFPPVINGQLFQSRPVAGQLPVVAGLGRLLCDRCTCAASRTGTRRTDGDRRAPKSPSRHPTNTK